MQASARTNRQLRMAGWLVVAGAWAVFLTLNWLDWRNGKATTGDVAHDIGRLAFVTLFLVAARIHRTWWTRRPKPPPVYRSTILD